MTDLILFYIFIWIIVILTIFFLSIWIEKIIKLLLWNYLLMLLTLASHQSLVLFTNFLQKTPTFNFLGLSYGDIANFVSNGKMTFIFILYLWLSLLIYYKSKIHISLPMDDVVQKILYIVLVPFTVVWIIFSLMIVFFGTTIFDPVSLSQLILQLPQNPILFTIISWMPVWLSIHALCTILITSELQIQIKTGM